MKTPVFINFELRVELVLDDFLLQEEMVLSDSCNNAKFTRFALNSAKKISASLGTH